MTKACSLKLHHFYLARFKVALLGLIGGTMKYLFLFMSLICIGFFQNCSKGSETFSALNAQAVASGTDAPTGGLSTTTDDPGSGSGSSCSGHGSANDQSNICIIHAPGKSLKLAYDDSVLAEQNAVPKVICTTADACLNIASQKFDIQSTERRGYCNGHNPNVLHLSADQLQQLIDVTQ